MIVTTSLLLSVFSFFLHASDDWKTGLETKAVLQTCSLSSRICKTTPVTDHIVTVLDKSDSVGLGIGPKVATSKSDADGKTSFYLDPGKYQGQCDRNLDQCPEGWFKFGTGCLGPVFVVSRGMVTRLKLQFVKWEN